MLMARLTALKVLPSPGKALVTMIRLPSSILAAPVAVALRNKGRLMTRYSSAMLLRG